MTEVRTALQQGEEMQRQLIAKAVEDDEFRAQLLADPKGAIQNEYGLELPDSIKLHVHESDINDLHIALPINPNVELDEQRLEAIAAGLSCCL